MRNPRAVGCGLLAMAAMIGPAHGQAPAAFKPSPAANAPAATDLSARPAIYSGYGNYWYPTGYPYPSIGGAGFVNFGFGGTTGTYYSVPGTSDPAADAVLNGSKAPAVAGKGQAKAAPANQAVARPRTVKPARKAR